MAKSAYLRPGRPFFLYGPSGFPIWGYSPCGRPIYAYTPVGAPIYVIRDIYRGCHVPAWNPGRITTALSGRRASAADIMPHALRHARPLSGPTAPGAHMKGPLPVSTAGKTHPHPPQSKRPAQSFLFIPGKKGRTSLPPAA